MTTAQLKTAAPPALAFKGVCAAARSPQLMRHPLAHHWDLFAVLALLGSCAVAGVSLLLNLVP